MEINPTLLLRLCMRVNSHIAIKAMAYMAAQNEPFEGFTINQATMASKLQTTRPEVSKAIKILKKEGVIAQTGKKGKLNIYKLSSKVFRETETNDFFSESDIFSDQVMTF